MGKPVSFPVRFSDLINYFASDLYVPEIHLIVHFEDRVDVQRLQKALRLLLDADPVLGCRFVEHWRKAFWVRIPEHELNSAEILTQSSASPLEEEKSVQGFYEKVIDGSVGPQIKALLISRQDADCLILKVNHVTCDAGGFKEVLYSLSSIYTDLGRDPNYRPEIRNGSRSLAQVYKKFSLIKRLYILWRGFVEFHRAGMPAKSQQYLSGEDKSAPLCFKFNHYSTEHTEQLIEYARTHNCTLNDLFVTAVFRAVAKQSDWIANKAKAMRINGTVDLRRYLPEGQADALCMLSGVYSVIIKEYADDTFEETLHKVKEQIDEQKAHYLGLGIMLTIYLILLPYPFLMKKKFIKKQWQNNLSSNKVPPAMSNVGSIDHQKVAFGKLSVKNIHMTVPACCPPSFSCGLSGYSGTLTLSSGFYPSAIPVRQMEHFFSLIDKELPIIDHEKRRRISNT